MAVKEQQRELLIEKRARALLIMLLTHRDDLLIEEVKANEAVALDYVVRFHTKGKEGLREFWIEVKGVWPALTKDRADKMLRPSLDQIKRDGPFLRPVCLFLFTMETDAAWYTWVAEPMESQDGRPQLSLCNEPDCRQLDKKALNEIIERVDLWHEAVFPRLVVNGPRKSKPDRKGAKQ
jgi:hypothetical protein